MPWPAVEGERSTKAQKESAPGALKLETVSLTDGARIGAAFLRNVKFNARRRFACARLHLPHAPHLTPRRPGIADAAELSRPRTRDALYFCLSAKDVYEKNDNP